MKTLAAVILGKLIATISKTFKIGGGSAAPGLYALKIDPDLVGKLSRKIPQNVVITGTNGKTTTARMLAHFAKIEGLKVIKNHTGSNLERGVTSTLVNSYSHISSGKVDLGIWELDEAAFNIVAPKIKPGVVLFLNVFRDQLDRYGEVDSVVKRWCKTLTTLKSPTQILLNGDDANTRSLKKCFKGKVQLFGVKDYKIVGEAIEQQKEQENYEFEAKNVKLHGLKGSYFHLQYSSLREANTFHLPVTLPLPGIYHIYDFLAAFAAGTRLGFSPTTMIKSLKHYSPAFGRMEKFSLQPSRLHRKDGFIFLIKNPAGATQVFETITPNLKPNDRLLFALNDNIADGRDVSWIWDAQWERLQETGYRLQVVASGTRAYDLANRLKYAGFDPKLINIEQDLKKAFRQAKDGLKARLFILPTYTAMLELQRILAKIGIKRHYWEEE
ncbi:DUF1727 domain-containing protein [Candidatus Microgenomates bacterium]|nr:DUF1727 domain-containing protein [Candidatus Microgenomates bacterium]